MASYQSYGLGPTPPIHPHAEHPYQQSPYHGLDVPILGTLAGYPTSAASIDLISRLVLLEKDLQLAHADNIKKDAIIHYLLYTRGTEPVLDNDAQKLKQEISSLEKKIARYEEEFQSIKTQLSRALDIIFTLSAGKVDYDGSQLFSVSGLSRCKAPHNPIPRVEDLIDLSNFGKEPVELTAPDEDTTLLEDNFDDLSDTETVPRTEENAQDFTASFSSDLTEDSAYIHHFITSSSCSTDDETLAGNGRQIAASHSTVGKKPKYDSDTTALSPSWSNSKVFKSEKERSATRLSNERSTGFTDLRYPHFKHGVRFNPDKSQRDVYRTVVVSCIPLGVELGMILNYVRGGPIIEANLLDTSNIKGKNSALITFLHEYSAMAYEEHAKNHPIIFAQSEIRVAVVSTPTWPTRIKLRKAIFDHQHTRCLEVHNFPRKIGPSKLQTELRVSRELKFHHIVHKNLRKDGVLELHFSGIDRAGQAYGMLSTLEAYSGCTVCFVPDPCAQPLDTLLQDGNGVDEDIAGPAPENPIAREDSATHEVVSFEPSCHIVVQDDTCVSKRVSIEPGDDSDGGESPASSDFGRLTEADFEDETEVRRGRGFEKKE